jgi:preprotein translocase subunit SecF
MSKLGTLGARLYDGEVSYDFVGRRKRWYAISAAILVLAIGGLLFRQLNLGIEFSGGAQFTVTAPNVSLDQARVAMAAAGHPDATVTQSGSDKIRITTQSLTNDESDKVVSTLVKSLAIPSDSVSVQLVGPTWGKEITSKALTALVVFLILVALFLSLYFEWRMAVAALVALAHDLVITIGIYALTGLEVTPATVIGLLTILGYSLYDTVVVFDKVKENTRGIASSNRMSYSQAANLALNQTLVRSINTTVIALIPVTAILIVGVAVLGASTLEDLALALFIGMASGAYSSIFVATPFLCQLKEREPAMQALSRRVESRQKTEAKAAPKTAVGGRTATAVLDRDGEDVDAGSASDETAETDPGTPGPKQPPRRNVPRSKRKGSGKR